MTSPAGFDEPPHSFLVAMTTPDGQAIAAIDLHYELAIEPASDLATDWTTAGLFVDMQPAGARVVVDDGVISAAYYLTADECMTAANYLYACAKAATDRQAPGS